MISEIRRRLGSQLPFVEIQVLVMKHTEHELDQVVRRVRELGVDLCESGFVIVNTLDRGRVEQWLPSNRELSRYEMDTGVDRFNWPDEACSWLWRSLVINWDGTVCPCCNFDRLEAEIGALWTNSVRDLWNSAMYREARRVFRSTTGRLPDGPAKPGQHICECCMGVPRAQTANQQGVYQDRHRAESGFRPRSCISS